MSDTIAAIATPSGQGGVAIVRVSGDKALAIAQAITGKTPTPRYATFAEFSHRDGEVFDQGVLLYFKAPHSFTGEDTVELQGHGGRAVTKMLLESCLAAGARMALPGEFSERAFLNDKIDLAQAEAIADLIEAQSQTAIKAAARSLHGAFSTVVTELADDILRLRVFIEAALDFPEEEIDFLTEGDVAARLTDWGERLARLIAQTSQGRLVNDGINLVLVGKPNAGKSSLLNTLIGDERAIVTAQAGTTRDIIQETIIIEGMPVNILDTAGLRESTDIVEREGIRRTRAALQRADVIVLLIDGLALADRPQQALAAAQALTADAPAGIPVITVFNKADLVADKCRDEHAEHLWIAAKEGTNVAALRARIAEVVGRQSREETPFIARERHVNALRRAQAHYDNAIAQLFGYRAGELVAEDLRLAHDALGEITGKINADELLGEIFSSFCIGK